MIAFVLPTNEFDELYIEQLEKSVKKGHRRRFTWFSKKDLIDLVKQIFLSFLIKKKRNKLN